MILCEHCFKDKELRSQIYLNGNKGKCDLCGKSEVNIYNTEVDSYLSVLFEGLFDIYIDSGRFKEGYNTDGMLSLRDELKNNWEIFANHITPYFIEEIIKEICGDYFTLRPSLLTNAVGIQKLADDEYLDKYSIVGQHSWGDFTESIKNKYRFHTDVFRKHILREYLPFLERRIKKGDRFYRARISGEDGYTVDHMGAPPPEYVTSGRINPEGLSYLYLADMADTTVYETRASLYDYVCIGEFVALEDMSIIDLTGLDKISVFFSDLDYELHAVNRTHLKRINDEIAKPVRSSDSHLEYLPTQYICDYIKSIQSADGTSSFKGIMYKSTMISGSRNVAVFEPDFFQCINVHVRQVSTVEYGYGD